MSRSTGNRKIPTGEKRKKWEKGGNCVSRKKWQGRAEKFGKEKNKKKKEKKKINPGESHKPQDRRRTRAKSGVIQEKSKPKRKTDTKSKCARVPHAHIDKIIQLHKALIANFSPFFLSFFSPFIVCGSIIKTTKKNALVL